MGLVSAVRFLSHKHPGINRALRSAENISSLCLPVKSEPPNFWVMLNSAELDCAGVGRG